MTQEINLASLDSEALDLLEKQIAKEKAERRNANDWTDNGIFMHDKDANLFNEYWIVTDEGEVLGGFLMESKMMAFKTQAHAELYRDKQLIRKALWKWAKLNGKQGRYVMCISKNDSAVLFESESIYADDLPRMDMLSWQKCLEYFSETKGEEYLKTLFKQNP